MIQIDMRMPKCCSECPCSLWIQTGRFEGQCMCQAMEFMGVELCRTIVDGYEKKDDCPMTEVEQE